MDKHPNIDYLTFKSNLIALIKKRGKVVPPEYELKRVYSLYQKGIKPKAPPSITVYKKGKPSVTKFLPNLTIDEKVKLRRKEKLSRLKYKVKIK